MKKRKLKRSGEEGYWKSFTDMMAGLLLVILLILMLLLLLMSQMRHETHLYDYKYKYEHQYDDNDLDSDRRHDYDHTNENTSNSSGGGGGGVDDPGDSEDDGIYVDIGHDKTAVFVTVVDAETKNVIKKDGILFELYAGRNARGGLCLLHTYYPEKIEYKQYKTTEQGTFYLPEKISNGWYSLHNLKAPPGYDLADNVDFHITESLDWAEPFLVEVPMSPVKGKIKIQAVDADNGASVPSQKYTVYAAEDIVTLDGTVRYRSGEKVDSFTCDKKGQGVSKKLYLGKYRVTQTSAAPYYALNKQPIEAEITLENTDEVLTVKCNKSKVILTLTDDYSGTPIPGAIYTLDEAEMITDSKGQIVITDLDKDKSYSVKLKSLPELYRSTTDTLIFRVNPEGLISDKTTLEMAHTAYMIRMKVDFRDMLFKKGVKGKEARLLDDSGQVVEEWITSNEPHIVEGLEPGKYTVEIRGMMKTTLTASAKDESKPCSVVKEVWTWLDTMAIVGGLVVLALAVYILITVARKVFKNRAEKRAAKILNDEK